MFQDISTRTREGFGSKADCSGYDEMTWIPRTWEQHQEYSRRHKLAQNLTEEKELEQKYGVRYSELSRLSYYNPIRCHLVDPMHCLLLGQVKHTVR